MLDKSDKMAAQVIDRYRNDVVFNKIVNALVHFKLRLRQEGLSEAEESNAFLLADVILKGQTRLKGI